MSVSPTHQVRPGKEISLSRVLILFRRQGMRGERVPPQVSPAGAIASAGVLRLLSQPHVAEKEGNTLAIDTGGSTYVPKNG